MGRANAAIVVAEDDDDDYLLTERAFSEAGFSGALHRVGDGEELMSFLLEPGGDGGGPLSRVPLLLLLDLNMPRKDGREALREIKSHPGLRSIPVVVLTTSSAEADVAASYALGANSFIRKPESFEQFSHVIKSFSEYWFRVSELPVPAGVRGAP